MTASETIAALTAALAAEREARQQAEARASGAEALVAYYKLQIAKLRREQYGQSSERGRKLLDQLELQLEEAAALAAEDGIAAAPTGSSTVHPFTRRKPVRAVERGTEAGEIPARSRHCNRLVQPRVRPPSHRYELKWDASSQGGRL